MRTVSVKRPFQHLSTCTSQMQTLLVLRRPNRTKYLLFLIHHATLNINLWSTATFQPIRLYTEGRKAMASTLDHAENISDRTTTRNPTALRLNVPQSLQPNSETNLALRCQNRKFHHVCYLTSPLHTVSCFYHHTILKTYFPWSVFILSFHALIIIPRRFFDVLHQNSVWIPCFLHPSHTLIPSYPAKLRYPKNTRWPVQITKSFVMYYPKSLT